MKTRWLNVARRHTVLAFLGLSLLAVGCAWADDADPPGRVARLSDIEGSVSLEPAGVEEWAAPSLNRPITTGDKLWADQDSRAELDFGDAAIRLGSTTGFSFLNLDDNVAQMQLTAGTLIVHLRNLQPNQSYEVDTPNIALSLQQPGDYRLEVDDSGDTTVVKVSSGAAQATGGGQSLAISTQQMVTFSGTAQMNYASSTLGAPDDLDNWSAGRERAREDSQSRRYVADDVPGTADLDRSGRWEETPDYGYVWTPTVVEPGWAPYRFGQWLWVAPWGWTWVDAAPWGYAPFHYGRWIVWNSAWCWVPGPRYVRPVYGPAIVGWVGGPRAGVSVGIGVSVGWFPLAPREVYVPAYHVSETYVRNVNITNTTIVNNTYITNVYQNNVTNVQYVHATPAAVTAVPQSVFASGERVGGHVVHLPREVLTGSAVAARAPAIVPARQSVVGAQVGRPVAHPPPSLINRTVVARTAPPRAPAPFERQVEAIRANGGRPLARTELARLQSAAPAASVRLVNPSDAASGRRQLPATPARESAAGVTRPDNASRPGGRQEQGNFAERERVLQNSQLAPAQRSDRPRSAGSEGAAPTTREVPPRAVPPGEAPPRAAGSSGTAAPRGEAAPAPRSDRPPSAQQHVPPTQQQEFHSDDPTHARGGPPSAPANRPPAEAPSAAGGSRPNESPYQEPRYRPPVAASPPPPAREAPAPPVREAPRPPVREAPPPPVREAPRPPVREAPPPPVREAPPPREAAPSAPPAYRPQEHPVAPSSPPPASHPQEHPAAPPPPQHSEQSKPEPRETAAHGDRNSRERGER